MSTGLAALDLLRIDADHPSLAPTADLDVARGLLAAWNAPTPEQAAARDRVVAFVDRYPEDAHRRSRLEGHLTASALLLDAAGERALLTLHRKLGRWLQLGGHCDGDANLPGVALRECAEESGIEGLAIHPVPVDVDVHVIPARPEEPEHLHLDTRFLVWAPPGARAVTGDESIDLRWLSPGELEGLPADPTLERLFRIAFGPGAGR